MPVATAQPYLLDPGIGRARTPRTLHPLADGRISPKDLSGLAADIAAVVALINGNLTLGDGSQGSIMGNLNGQVFYVTGNGVADAVWDVIHALNRTPIGFIPFHKTKDGGGLLMDLYSWNRTSWNSQLIQVASVNASVGQVYFFVF